MIRPRGALGRYALATGRVAAATGARLLLDPAGGMDAGRAGLRNRDAPRGRALSAAFGLHLAKPVEPAELVAAIDRLARRRSA